MAGQDAAEKTMWTWQDDKAFETCLVEFPENMTDRWEKIAAKVGTKSVDEVVHHYGLLVDDIMAIEAGDIPLPKYVSEKAKHAGRIPRRAANPWTEEEHSQFLAGLEKYGKGDWKSISRYAVIKRSPAQVASHAQKHFERQEREEQTKKRRSIFDNNSADDGPAN